jgi:Tol biopolymer transport system component
VRGDPRKVTNVAGHYSRATFSADGRMIAFQSQRGSRWTIMVLDRTTARIVDLAVSARPGGPVISPDGTKVAYLHSDGASYVVATRGGAPRKLCDDCGIGDWTPDGRWITTTRGGKVREVKLVDVDSGETATLLTGDVNRVHLSPDSRWLALRTIDEQRSRVFAARFRPGAPPSPSEWVPITDREVDVRPCGWSPSGRMLYLVSSRDGFRCLYACPWDPDKGQPRGPVQLVRHIHNIRNLSWGGASVISTGNGNAIMKDQVLLDFATTVSNIWTMQLPVSQ